MTDTEVLLSRFAAEHFERHSIGEHRRRMTMFTLEGLAARLGGRTLAELTPSDVMAWQGAELKRGLAPNTMRNRESMVRAFIGWAYTAGVLSFEQMTQLKSVRPVRGAKAHIRPRPYKRSELERFREILATAYPLAPKSGKGSLMFKRYLQGQSRFGPVVKRHAWRLQLEAQVSLALEEGLRAGEVYALTMAQLHPDNGAVIVATAKSEPGQVRMREVPWMAHSRLCVYEWLEFRNLLAPDHSDPWLRLSNLDPLSPESRDYFIRNSLPMTDEGKRYGWHRFRHTFATERLRAGMPLEQVQVMMGHARLEQTLAYAQIVSADVAIHAAASEADFARNLGLEAA